MLFVPYKKSGIWYMEQTVSYNNTTGAAGSNLSTFMVGPGGNGTAASRSAKQR